MISDFVLQLLYQDMPNNDQNLSNQLFSKSDAHIFSWESVLLALALITHHLNPEINYWQFNGSNEPYFVTHSLPYPDYLYVMAYTQTSTLTNQEPTKLIQAKRHTWASSSVFAEICLVKESLDWSSFTQSSLTAATSCCIDSYRQVEEQQNIKLLVFQAIFNGLWLIVKIIPWNDFLIKNHQNFNHRSLFFNA